MTVGTRAAKWLPGLGPRGSIEGGKRSDCPSGARAVCSARFGTVVTHSRHGTGAPVAQLDRALASEARGHRFESCRVRQSLLNTVVTPLNPNASLGEAVEVYTMLCTKGFPYLYQRGSIFYFNRRVPSDLQRHYRCQRIVSSFRTSFIKAARVKSASLTSQLNIEKIGYLIYFCVTLLVLQWLQAERVIQPRPCFSMVKSLCRRSIPCHLQET